MLLVDQNEALAAIPAMLPPDRQTRLAAFELVEQALGARGEFSAEDRKRMNEVARLFGVDADARVSPNLALVPSAGAHGPAKVSCIRHLDRTSYRWKARAQAVQALAASGHDQAGGMAERGLIPGWATHESHCWSWRVTRR